MGRGVDELEGDRRRPSSCRTDARRRIFVRTGVGWGTRAPRGDDRDLVRRAAANRLETYNGVPWKRAKH